MKSKRTGIVKFRLDPANPAKLTAKQKTALQVRPIDHSDIPSQKGMTWTRPGALIPAENKQQITLRLDADLLQFFRKTGKRYQSRINAALREYVNAHKKPA
ncbi:MAG: BrnA antitoxin family protein [Silvibacterium sp.]